MSTPTTVKFQIVVPSTDGNDGAEQLYTLALSLEAVAEGENEVTPMGDIPLPKDPPTTTAADPMGDIPLPKDPPTATVQVLLPSLEESSVAEQVCTLALSLQVEGESGSGEIQVTEITDDPDDFEITEAA